MQVEEAECVKDGVQPTVRVLDFQTPSTQRAVPESTQPENRGIPKQADPKLDEGKEVQNTIPALPVSQSLIVETSILNNKNPVNAQKKAKSDEFVLTLEDDGEFHNMPDGFVVAESESQNPQLRGQLDASSTNQDHNQSEANQPADVLEAAKNSAGNPSQPGSSKKFKITSQNFSRTKHGYTMDEAKPFNKLYKKIPGLLAFGLDFEHPLARESEAIVHEEEISENSHGWLQTQEVAVSSRFKSKLANIPETDRVPSSHNTGRTSQMSGTMQSSQGPFLLRSTLKRLENYEEKIRRQPKLTSLVPKHPTRSNDQNAFSVPFGKRESQPFHKHLALKGLQTLQEMRTKPVQEQKLPRTFSATKVLQDIYEGKTVGSEDTRPRAVLSKHSLKFLSMREKRFLSTRESLKSNAVQKYEDCVYGRPVKGWGMTVGKASGLQLSSSSSLPKNPTSRENLPEQPQTHASTRA